MTPKTATVYYHKQHPTTVLNTHTHTHVDHLFLIAHPSFPLYNNKQTDKQEIPPVVPSSSQLLLEPRSAGRAIVIVVIAVVPGASAPSRRGPAASRTR